MKDLHKNLAALASQFGKLKLKQLLKLNSVTVLSNIYVITSCRESKTSGQECSHGND